MEFRQILYFMEVAKLEHMTEAAESLLVAQSAISRQIANLEEELGVKLFVRQGRRLRLTPTGRMFYARMSNAMRLIEQAKREIAEELEPEKGTVRIAFPISLAAYMLPMVISAFRKQYPDTKFQLKQSSYRTVIEEVMNGDFNMGLVGPVPTEDTRVNGSILFTENIVALVPITHPLAGRSAIRLPQLEGEPLILLSKGLVFRDMIVSACVKEGFEPTVAFEGDDVDALKGLASAGLGISLIPEVTMLDNVPRSTVKIPIVDPSIPRTIGVVTPVDRELLPTETLFYNFIHSFYKAGS
ncbi:LysR family transcriptional regulator [Alkalihalobacillus oceani]|uniref:LysR family transcriptional regulator n=1 Tax=Halalkalibacter oceani TaxID=1653776 RepID=A0A9X2IPE1_9BACI|nr:LysR family transcriptional regulator [Halalkalibacter oceani]